MGEREYDAGLDTPTAYEPGAGQPVPGSPVWEDAKRREEINEEQRRADIDAAQNPERGDEVKPNVTDSTNATAAVADETATTRTQKSGKKNQ